MKVGIKDKTSTTVAEMDGASGEVGVIAEMLTDHTRIESIVPIAGLGDRAHQMAEALGDDTPQFPIVRVEEGWSRGKKLYTSTFMVNVAEQINKLEPVGHLGHIPDDQVATAFPEVQTTWLGAVTKTEPSQSPDRKGEKVTALYAVGYNHPKAKIRDYIKAKAVRGVSWFGHGELVPVPGKGAEVRNFALKALDWARKGAEGMPTSSIVAVTSEMEARMDKDLSQVTPEEFKKENPNGYALLVAEAIKEKDDTIAEMTNEAEGAKKKLSILDQVMQLLGVEDADKLAESVTSIKAKVGEKASAMVKSALDTLLEEKVPDEQKRVLVRRLLPVGEMETKASDAADQEAVTKLVSEMVTEAFDKDEVIQSYVGEMTAPAVRRREELRGGAGLDNNTYIETRERVTLG